MSVILQQKIAHPGDVDQIDSKNSLSGRVGYPQLKQGSPPSKNQSNIEAKLRESNKQNINAWEDFQMNKCQQQGGKKGQKNAEGGLKQKKSRVIIHVMSSINEKLVHTSINQSAISSKFIDRNPSLKKITKFSSENNHNLQIQKQDQQWASNCLKKVKFEQIFDESFENQNAKKNNDKEMSLNKYFLRIKLENPKNKEKDSQSFMQFLCGLIRMKPKFLQRPNNKIQKRILGLQNLKVTGSKQEIMLLKQICKGLTLGQAQIKGKVWLNLGFPSEDPLQQLENIGVLTLLQWRNFISQQPKQAVKLFNLCIQLSCSLFNFHKRTTQILCSEIQNFRVEEKTWEDYQKLYNLLILSSNQQITANFAPSKLEKAQVFMIETLNKLGKKLSKLKKLEKFKRKIKIAGK